MSSHLARKQLFRRGLLQGWLSAEEIDRALPATLTSPFERWLFYYCLRAAQIEIARDRVDVEGLGKAVEAPVQE